ncbi:uncharacterized protein LOC126689009 [Quercus robur]|uniref:uncharacterized protein LOC126689009 n=1 Tax=Quercus robur TaxID=38942 RepID=UPI00216366DF|nr:uncharacterized protein LOC126689009 [Quercus robur]
MSVGNATDPTHRDRPKVETERGGVICLLPNNLSEIGVEYVEVYISDTSNECSNNLSIEEEGDCTKFQKLDVQTNVQLTPTSVLKENKRAYSGTTTKQQRKKIQKTL